MLASVLHASCQTKPMRVLYRRTTCERRCNLRPPRCCMAPASVHGATRCFITPLLQSRRPALPCSGAAAQTLAAKAIHGTHLGLPTSVHGTPWLSDLHGGGTRWQNGLFNRIRRITTNCSPSLRIDDHTGTDWLSRAILALHQTCYGSFTPSLHST